MKNVLKRSVTLMLACALILAFGMIIGVSQGASAKTSILSIDVTYAAGTGPASGDVTLPEDGHFTLEANTLAAAPTCKDTEYTFVGWKGPDNKIYKAGGTYTADATTTSLTFTAVWGVKVTYDVNLSDKDENITTPATDIAIYKTKYPIPETATLTATYYTFLGWSTLADATAAEYKVGDSVAADSVSGPFTLYAVWKANFFSVIYHANTDSDANDSAVAVPVDSTKYMDTNLTATVMGNSSLASTNANYAKMTDATPTRSGYTFGGWATSATATTAEYQPGATFTISKDMDLYAVWTAGSTSTTSTTPQTGDSDHFGLYIALALLCLLGIGYLCYDQRKAKALK